MHPRRPGQTQSGQAATEYLLIISIAVIGLVSSAYAFAPQMSAGIRGLSEDVQHALAEHDLEFGGSGTPSNSGHGMPAAPGLYDAAPDFNPASNWYRNQLRDVPSGAPIDPIQMEWERQSQPWVPGVTAGADPIS